MIIQLSLTTCIGLVCFESSFVFHQLFAGFSSPFVHGISGIEDFVAIHVINVGIKHLV